MILFSLNCTFQKPTFFSFSYPAKILILYFKLRGLRINRTSQFEMIEQDLNAALFTIAKLWKEPEYLLTDKWIKKM